MRLRLQLAKVFWSLADHATARHLLREIDDILQHRPALGVLVDQVADFRAFISSTEQTEPAGGPPLTPAELRLLPYLQTHLSIREIGERLYISRNTVSSEVGSIYRKLGVSARSDAVERGDGDGAARRLIAAVISFGVRSGRGIQCVVEIVSQRHRNLRCSGDDERKSDDGDDADEHVDDLLRGRARADRGVGLRSERRLGTADGHERGDAGERQGLGIEPVGRHPDLAEVVFGQPFIVDGQSSEPFRIVHVFPQSTSIEHVQVHARSPSDASCR